MSEEYKKGTDNWWQSRVKKALKQRSEQGFESRWSTIREYYEQRTEVPGVPNFNLIYMLASSLMPSLVYNGPSIINSPRRPEFAYWATFFDSIDNWWFDEICMEDLAEEAVLQAFLYNIVGFQIGYDFPEEDDEDTPPSEMVEFRPVKGCVDRSRKTNQAWVDIIPPERLIVAPGTKNISNCPWFGKLLLLPTDKLKDKPGFKNVETTHIPDEIRKKSAFKHVELDGDDIGYTAFWEIHNAEDKKYLCIDSTGKIILSAREDPLQVDGLPLELLIFNKPSDTVWGTPDSLYVESQYLEGNEVRRMARAQRKIALVKFLYDSAIYKKEDVDKLLAGDEMVHAIGVELEPEKTMQNSIMALQPHVQMELSQVMKELLNDAKLLTGVGDNQAGSFASGRKTKYETQVVEENSLLRSSARRRNLGGVIGRIAGRMNQLVMKHWKAQVVSKVVGVDAAIYWVQAKPSEFRELAAQLVTKVNIESMTPVSRERKRQELAELIQMISSIPGMNPLPLLQSFLTSFNYVDASKILPQQQGEAMGMGQFQGQQQQLLGSGNLPQQVQQNLGGMGSMIEGLPGKG